QGGKRKVKHFEGEVLTLSKITRSDMGAYLCIASNGVPPSVSKRMTVQVHCKSLYVYLSCVGELREGG
ncbi:unnamed protein product, partial [Allacma fusca]